MLGNSVAVWVVDLNNFCVLACWVRLLMWYANFLSHSNWMQSRDPALGSWCVSSSSFCTGKDSVSLWCCFLPRWQILCLWLVVSWQAGKLEKLVLFVCLGKYCFSRTEQNVCCFEKLHYHLSFYWFCWVYWTILKQIWSEHAKSWQFLGKLGSIRFVRSPCVYP